MIKNAIKFFINFHKGFVNILLHIIGFLIIFYSIYKFNWLLFTLGLVILEFGHFYNHLAKIEPYDFRPKIIIYRIAVFIVIVLIFFFISKYLIH